MSRGSQWFSMPLSWRYTWRDAAGVPGYVRGVDLFRVRGGKVAEKLAYVKG